MVTLLFIGLMFMTSSITLAQEPAAPPPAAAPAPAPAAAPAAPLKVDSGDTSWLLTSSALVLLMTAPGLALFYAGMVRRKACLRYDDAQFYHPLFDQRPVGPLWIFHVFLDRITAILLEGWSGWV